MIVHLVADIGNTNIKWGLCSDASVKHMATLPLDDPDAWLHQLDRWNVPAQSAWLIAGVHPARHAALANWLTERGHCVQSLGGFDRLPLQINLPQPEKVGLDRLLNAVAANSIRKSENAALIIDAGSAVTVDFVDASGAFCGGAIFPGMRLMARSLHEYTALLPLVQPIAAPSPLGNSTIQAIETGIYHAVLGGVRAILDKHRSANGPNLELFLTGGDALLLAEELFESTAGCLWPQMTLEGIRLSAANQGRG